MQIQFANPMLLWLLVPLFAHVLFMARRLQMMSTARRIFSVGVRLLVLTLIVFALSGIRIARETKDLTVFYVLDRSRSLPNTQNEYAQAWLEQSTVGMNSNLDKAGLIVFGADAAVERSPDPRPEFVEFESVIDRSRTNLSDALRLALACFVGETQKRIVVLSDGNQNTGDAVEQARSAAAAGITIDVLPLEYQNRNDAILEKAIVESRVSLDEPFDVRVIASASEDTRGRLSIFMNGNMIGYSDVVLEGGQKNVFSVPTEVTEAGFHTFDVRLDIEGDANVENNHAYAFTYGEGEPRIMLVDGDLAPSQALPSMLMSENIKVDLIGPESFPITLNELQTFDAVIFNNVQAGDISSGQMELMESAVHDLGVGFIMIGGENSFGAGGWNDSPIERILPVNMEIKNEKVLPQGALVPIVHTVEIPDGQRWAIEIISAALDVLSPQDLMGVMGYDYSVGENWMFPLQEVGQKGHIRALLNNVPMGDMPSFDKTMQMAYSSLVTCGAAVKHMIIISDGDPQTPNKMLATKIRAAGITISTICINPHSPRDAKVMKDLADWGGGNFYHPTSYNTLPQIFIKEASVVRKALIIEEPFQPVVAGWSPALAGFGDGYPMLRGYVGTSEKELADVPLKTERDDPLLATWQHGVGRTAAFTSDAKERWANQWVGWNQYRQFWSQLLRWTLRKPYNKNYQVEMNIDGTQGKITIDAVNDTGDFRNFLDINGNLITPGLDQKPLQFRQTSPGRYEAQFDADQPGTYMFGAQSIATGEEGTDAEIDLVTGGTSMSYSPEFQHSSSNPSILYRLADITRGRVLDANSQVFLHDQRTYSDPRSIWPILLGILLGLFLLDVFLRRVMVNWGDIRHGLAIAGGWISGRLVLRPGSTGTLLEKKKALRDGETAPGEGRTSAPDPDAPQPQSREVFLKNLKSVKTQSTAARNLDSVEIKDKGAKREVPGEKPEADKGTTGSLLEARKRAQGKFKKD